MLFVPIKAKESLLYSYEYAEAMAKKKENQNYKTKNSDNIDVNYTATSKITKLIQKFKSYFNTIKVESQSAV